MSCESVSPAQRLARGQRGQNSERDTIVPFLLFIYLCLAYPEVFFYIYIMRAIKLHSSLNVVFGTLTAPTNQEKALVL